MGNNVARHPSAQRRFGDVVERFMKETKAADRARNIQQLGILTQFDDEELEMLKNYLCDNDRRLLKMAGRLLEDVRGQRPRVEPLRLQE